MRAATALKHGGEVPYRVVVPGAELQLLVLAAGPTVCVGVDLDSGAFVRASYPADTNGSAPFDGEFERPFNRRPLAPFDVAAGRMAGAPEPPDASCPEALELLGEPEAVGQLSPKRAERLLAPLHHPPQLPLLGLVGTAVPYWTLSGDRPSLALVNLRNDARLRWGPYGPECHFVWQGAMHELPFIDSRMIARLERDGIFRPSRGEVERVLGFRPRRLLVMLTPPENGYCYKAVGALLPPGR